MRYKGVSHVAFATGDLEKTIRFWRDLVGLRLVLCLGRKGDKQYFFQIAEKQYLGFFEWPGVEPVEEKEAGYPARGPVGFDHVALAVDTADDLWDVKERIDSAGEWVSEVIDHGFIRSIYTFDPNGISIEFSVDTDLDLGADPQFHDQDPSGAAREGSEPVRTFWPEPAEKTPLEERRVYPGFGSELGGDDG